MPQQGHSLTTAPFVQILWYHIQNFLKRIGPLQSSCTLLQKPPLLMSQRIHLFLTWKCASLVLNHLGISAAFDTLGQSVLLHCLLSSGKNIEKSWQRGWDFEHNLERCQQAEDREGTMTHKTILKEQPTGKSQCFRSPFFYLHHSGACRSLFILISQAELFYSSTVCSFIIIPFMFSFPFNFFFFTVPSSLLLYPDYFFVITPTTILTAVPSPILESFNWFVVSYFIKINVIYLI